MIPLYWFKEKYLIGYVDYFPYVNYKQTFFDFLYLWINQNSLGQPNPVINGMPFFLIGYLFSNLGLSSIFIEKFILISSIIASGISVYFLLLILGFKRPGRLVGSVFYIINPYAVHFFWSIQSGKFYVIYGFAPLIFLLFLKMINEKNKDYFKVIVLLNVIAIFTLNTLNIVNVLLFYMLLFLFYIILCFLKLNNFRFNTKRILLFYTVSILLNFFWLMPLLMSLTEVYFNNTFLLNKLSTLDLALPFKNSSYEVLNLLRFYFNEFTFSTPIWYPDLKYYQSNIIVLLSFIFPVFLIMPLLFKNKINKNNFILSFYLITLAITFIVSGYYNPAMKWIFENLIINSSFLTRIFANLTTKFLIFLPLFISPIIAIATDLIIESISKPKIKLFGVILLLILFGIISKPYFTGEYILNDEKWVSYYIKIPTNYNTEILNTNELTDFKILPLPLPYTSYIAFDWGKHNYISQPDNYLFSYPIIQSASRNNLLFNIWQNLDNISSLNPNSISLLQFFSIKYIVLHYDTWWDFLPYQYPVRPNTKLALQNIESLLPAANYSLISENSNFKIFESDKSMLLPHIYVPDVIYSMNDYNFTQILSYVNSEDNRRAKAFYIKIIDQNPGLNISAFTSKSSNSHPVIEFKKINPTKYRVIVHNATDEFPLVLSESFHSGWKVYILDKKIPSVSYWNRNKTLHKYEEDNSNLSHLINQGMISFSGDGFISENIKGTVQNNNLPTGNIFETWSIDYNDSIHFLINGYANGWIISPPKNKGGSYNNDFEIVIEYLPQKLFYLGVLISGITFFLCVGYIIYRSGKYLEYEKN